MTEDFCCTWNNRRQRSDGLLIRPAPEWDMTPPAGFNSDSMECPASRPMAGSALIGLLAAILVFSVLAAAIVPMVSSSGQQIAAGDMAAKAYLLAESGFRYAAGEYLRAGASQRTKNQKIDDLEGDYTLRNNNNGFSLEIYAYHYALTAQITRGDTTFFAHAPGTFPGSGTLADEPEDEIELDKTQGLKFLIGDEIANHIYTLKDPVAVSGDTLQFTTTKPLDPFPANVNVYPAAEADTVRTPTISHGGDLAYKDGMGEMFPLRNGQIRVGDRTLIYRLNDKHENQFLDVRDPRDPGMSDHPVATVVVLTRYVRLHATGIYGSGESAVRRTLVYYAPLPLSETTTLKEEFTDRLNDTREWSEVSGTHTRESVDENSALRVETTAAEGTDRGSLVRFNPSSDEAAGIDFNASRRGSNGFLSYDCQIKVGYGTLPAPDNVAAGLSFRLNNVTDVFNSHTFGLSFVSSDASNDTGIPDDIVPLPGRRAIVLWEQTSQGRAWLAYQDMTVDLHYGEDFEAGNGHWTLSPGDDTQNLWNTAGRISGALYYGRESDSGDFNYDVGPTSGAVESPQIILPGDASDLRLTFRSRHQTEPVTDERPGGPDGYDRKQVFLRVDEGEPQLVYTISSDSGEWRLVEINLPASYAGHTIRIRFAFDSVDDLNNAYEGWTIDDVRVYSDQPWPVAENATLAVRLKEAMVVRFKEGTSEIRSGDRIFGALGGTIGTVIEPPIISNNGEWSEENPATGTLLLNRTSVIDEPAFEAGEVLTVMGGTGRAVVESYAEETDRKANIIRVYYASKSGYGDELGNDNPFDRITRPYPRLTSAEQSLEWPADLDQNGHWMPETDFFRFIRWDKINPAVASGLYKISRMTPDYGRVDNAIIQRYHQDLKTPDFPSAFTAAEIGLHTFGQGSTEIYFDDFGIQIQVAADNFLPLPLMR